MKTANFAIFGAKPAFGERLPIGQLYFPAWDRYEAAMRGIFDRQYYNNNGPLHQVLDEKLRDFLGVKHAICVHNETLGLMMAADAMALSGKVILPAFASIALAQSLSWAGLEPVFCDIDPETHQIGPGQVEELITEDVSAILGVNLWGGVCDIKALAGLAKFKGIRFYLDSAHAFGCEVDGVKTGNFGNAEVFSFHAENILNSTEGGCICTGDDAVAARLRSIRPSYGPEIQAHIVRVANARMSEAQAAIALMSLEDFPANRKKNETLYRIYERRLDEIPGLRLASPAGVSASNYQQLTCLVDEDEFGISRDVLMDVLRAENVMAGKYFYPGLHRSASHGRQLPQYLNRLPNTEKLCAACMQLPISALVSAQSVELICDILLAAHQNAGDIRLRLTK